MDRKLVGALVAVLALAGCGSDTLSKTDLAKQANAICRRRTAQIASAEKRHPGDFRGYVAAALPAISKSLVELDKLKPASEVKTSYAQFLAGQRGEVDQAKAIVDAQRTGRRPSSSQASEQVRRRGAQTARSLGISACS